MCYLHKLYKIPDVVIFVKCQRNENKILARLAKPRLLARGAGGVASRGMCTCARAYRCTCDLVSQASRIFLHARKILRGREERENTSGNSRINLEC